MKDVGIKAYNLPISEWDRAVMAAKAFMRDYPDRRGIRDCVVYSYDDHEALLVYRTANFVVVRGMQK